MSLRRVMDAGARANVEGDADSQTPMGELRISLRLRGGAPKQAARESAPGSKGARQGVKRKLTEPALLRQHWQWMYKRAELAAIEARMSTGQESAPPSIGKLRVHSGRRKREVAYISANMSADR